MAMEPINSTLNKPADSVAPEAHTLKATEDKFGGVIIDSQDLPEASVFLASLKHSLVQWRTQVFDSWPKEYKQRLLCILHLFLGHSV